MLSNEQLKNICKKLNTCRIFMLSLKGWQNRSCSDAGMLSELSLELNSHGLSIFNKEDRDQVFALMKANIKRV